MVDDLHIEQFPKLFIQMPLSTIRRFTTVMQSGFYLQSTKNSTVGSFLSDIPGFTNEYIANRLQTVFLNGDAIDDFNITFNDDSCVLALSAAMPGLAGAIFRKSSIAAGLRKTAASRKGDSTIGSTCIQLKLFNNIAVERGPDILSTGVIFNSHDLAVFLDIRPSIGETFTQLTLDNVPLNKEELQATLYVHKKIILTCQAADG